MADAFCLMPSAARMSAVAAAACWLLLLLLLLLLLPGCPCCGPRCTNPSLLVCLSPHLPPHWTAACQQSSTPLPA
jgi:hypothetical protein